MGDSSVVISGGIITVKTGDTSAPSPTTDEQPDVLIILKPGGKLTNVKVTKRKTDTGSDVLLTVNKSTVVVQQ